MFYIITIDQFYFSFSYFIFIQNISVFLVYVLDWTDCLSLSFDRIAS